MRAKGAVAVLCLATLAAPACGKKGPILPPLALVPQRAENITAYQRGSRILVEWTDPTSYIDGRRLGGIAEVEIWLEERPDKPGPAPAGDFAARARRVASVVPKPAPQNTETTGAEIALAPGAWAGKMLILAVRVREAKKNRFSEFSDEVAVTPRVLPLPPTGVTATVFADRVELQWNAPAENIDRSTPALVKGYHVYRIDKTGKISRLTQGPKAAPPYADTTFEFNQAYAYFVRSAASTSEPFLESDDSSVVKVMPLDIFPPAVPLGLTAAPGPDFITLIWDANKEKDLAGYRVWRRAEGQPDLTVLTPEPVRDTAFNDRTVEKGKRYDYAISAVDRAGNESPRSAAVTEIIKEPGS
jgi:predicted small lipoprotein YifL